MNRLNDNEASTVRHMLSRPGWSVNAAAVCQLLSSSGDGARGWQRHALGSIGVVALVCETGSSVRQLRFLALKASTVVFEQELYTGFTVASASPTLLTFEGDTCVFGLHCADVDEARKLHSAIIGAGTGAAGSAAAAAGGGGGAALPPPPAGALPPPTNKSAAALHSPPPASALPPPPTSPTVTVATPPPATGNAASTTPTTTTTPTTSTATPPPRKSSTAQRSDMKKQSSSGFFTALFGPSEEEIEEKRRAELDLSAPTGFRHVSHVGLQSDGTFDVNNLPDDWKKLFKMSGVKKKDLRDAETCKVIIDTVASETLRVSAGDAHAKPAQMPMAPERPAHAAAAAPPALPPKASAPLPPPPPPPPAAPNAPPPPPPPKPDAAGGGGGGGGGGDGGASSSSSSLAPPPARAPSMGGLADQLASTKLRSASEREVPELPDLDSAQGNSVASALEKAMKSRRNFIQTDDDDDDGNNNDWDDDDW